MRLRADWAGSGVTTGSAGGAMKMEPQRCGKQGRARDERDCVRSTDST